MAALGVPFPRITCPKQNPKAQRSQLELDLHAKLAAAQSPDAQDNLRRQITGTDRAINELVYDLYGLTAAERALVEGLPTAGVTDDSALPVVIQPTASLPQGRSTPESEAAAAHFYFVKEDPPEVKE